MSFEEAKTVFFDENARLMPDPEHSHDEERFILLGLSSIAKMLVVLIVKKIMWLGVSCLDREKDNVVRIISARKATKKESMQYKGEYHEKRI